MKWKLVEPPAVAPPATARRRDLAWLIAASAANAVGAAALQTTIAGREAHGAVEFLVVGASIRAMVIAGALAAALVVLAHHLLVRLITPRASGQSPPGSTRYLRRLLWCAIPAAGVAAAMAGGRPAPPLVYAFWETAPVWVGAAWVFTMAEFVKGRLTGAPAAPAVLAVATASVIAWVLASNVSLRSWSGPVGDEPRYLRHDESWYQGQGADISRMTRMADAPLHQPPRIVSSLGLAARAAAGDARDLIVDTVQWVSRPGFVWNRARNGDGAFLIGRHGGVYQTYQPGLSLLILPGYAIDRWLASTTVFEGQFPGRVYGVYATLLALVAATVPLIAALCRQIDDAVPVAALLSALSLAMLPAASLALQIYPETAACLAIAGSLALLTSGTPSRRRAALAGAVAGYLVFLHARFLPVAVVLLGYGVWRLRASRLSVTFGAGWLAAAFLQIWYVYHATGLPWPTAFYEASGISPLGPRTVAVNMLRFAFDRDWGVLPHAPLVMLAAAGWLPLWRARRDLAIVIALVVLTLTATAASHTVSAAGGTPDRLIAASVPLLAVPVAAAVRAWRRRPLFRILIVLLAVLSLVQAWDYNRSHVKEVGQMIAPGVSGWRVNLLFPYLSDGLTHQALPALAGSALALVAVTIALVRTAGRESTFGFASAAAGTTIGIVLLVTGAGAWDGSHPRYRSGAERQRQALVAAYVRAGTCALCWSSERGAIPPEALGPNGIEKLDLDAVSGPSRRAAFRLTASGPDGPVFGVVRFDFGDGQVSPPKVMMGGLDVVHQFGAAGEYAVKAWLERPGEGKQAMTARVQVKE